MILNPENTGKQQFKGQCFLITGIVFFHYQALGTGDNQPEAWLYVVEKQRIFQIKFLKW